MKRCQAHNAKGFTLAESLVAATILAMTIAAITAPFAAGTANERADARLTLATNLAQEMMEEILSAPFSDGHLGHENGETRWSFNAVEDYDGYVEPVWSIASSDGRIFSDPAAAGLSRHVSVTQEWAPGQHKHDDPAFLRVVVTVRYHGQDVVSLSRLVYSH